jgi:hypothetical protein
LYQIDSISDFFCNLFNSEIKLHFKMRIWFELITFFSPIFKSFIFLQLL